MESHDYATIEDIHFYVLVPNQLAMTRDKVLSRRTAMKLTGAAAATALVAGCSDNGDDNGGADDNGDDDDANGDADGFEIDPDETIVLEGITGGWEGIEPSQIEGEENPTLILQDGEDYEITWEQGDGSQHNVQLWDENEEIVEDYETDLTDDPDPEGDDLLEFTATDEIAYYRCDPHPNMQGEVQVE